MKEVYEVREYIKSIYIMVLWQIIFLVSCVYLNKEYFIYTNFVFYLGIIIYFVYKGDFKFELLKVNLRSGKKFWIPVFYTIVFFIVAFASTCIFSSIFNIDDGTMNISRNTWTKLMIFAISTIIFPPLAEELFYRQGMICLKNKKTIIITTLISMFLYALEHCLTLYGIIITMIWALPLSISYIKTKNVYIPIAAHFIVNLIGNGASVVITAIYLLN